MVTGSDPAEYTSCRSGPPEASILGEGEQMARLGLAKIPELARSELQLFRRLRPDALTLREQWSVFLFVLRHTFARMSRYRVACGDVQVALRGRRYLVGLISGEIEVVAEIYRERIYDRLDNFIPQPGWTVFDVGANIGLFAVLQAGRGAVVHAFEPNDDCFRRLTKNAEENGLRESITAHKVALGRARGTAVMHVPWNATHSGSLFPSGSVPRSVPLPVNVMSLDDLVQDLNVPHIDLLKIDVEGAEAEVLHGAAQALDRTARLIVEYHSADLRQQVLNLLHDKGFAPATEVVCYPPAIGVLYAERKSLCDQEQ